MWMDVLFIRSVACASDALFQCLTARLYKRNGPTELLELLVAHRNRNKRNGLA